MAERVFGSQLHLALRYVELLSGAGAQRGLIGPREVGRLWDRHVLNCAVVEELVPGGARVVDIGSGGGLPGLVLAIARPDLHVTLLESRLRPTTFLSECVAELELRSVTIKRGRAEELASELAADVVTARAVGALSRLTGWALPMLAPAGELLALKGERADEELAAARPVLERLGVRDVEIVAAGTERVDYPTTVVRVVAPDRVAATRRPRPTRRGSGPQ